MVSLKELEDVWCGIHGNHMGTTQIEFLFRVISPYSCATADELSQICLSYFFGLAMIDVV